MAPFLAAEADMDVYEHPGYLSRTDKIFFVVAILVLGPLAVVGWPFLAAGVLIFIPLRVAFHLVFRKRGEDDPAAKDLQVSFSSLRSKPARIRHNSTRFPNS